jgi:hypothetical protein
MDSFTRKYLIALGVAAVAAAAWWLLSLDFRVSELNSLLAADQELSGYPYQFRVLSLEDGTAEMSSPRSASVPVVQFLTAAFPELRNLPLDDPAVMLAQDQLVAMQARAAQLVKAQADVNSVRWVLDERWFADRGVILQP